MGVSLSTVIALRGVQVVDDLAALQAIQGQDFRLYVTRNNGDLYLWNGTTYEAIVVNNMSILFQGLYDASTNTPDAETTLTTNGEALIVSVAGEQTIDGVAYTGTDSLKIGDMLVETTAGIRRIPFQEAIAQNVTSGRIPRVVDGAFLDSAMRETTTEIISDKTVIVPQGSIVLGDATRISEYGGIIQVTSNITDNEYLPVLYQETAGTIDDIGSSNPFYFTFDPAQDFIGDIEIIGTWNADTDVATVDGTDTSGYQNVLTEDNTALRVTTAGNTVVGSITSWAVGDFLVRASGAFEKRQLDTNTISDVSTIDITSLSFRNRLHTMTFDFSVDVTNFRARVTNLDNSEVVKYFPSRAVYESGTGGLSFSTGKQEVYPAGQAQATPIILPANTNFRIEIAADAQIDLNGDSNDVPYVAVNVCRANINFLTDSNDEDAIHDNVAGEINAIASKASPADADILLIEDSTDNFNKKKIRVDAVTGGMNPAPPVASVHEFSINLPERIDIGATPDPINGSRTVTYRTTNYSRITTLALQLNGTDNVTLTLPTTDGQHTEAVTLSGIDISSQTNLDFRIQANGSINSNVQRVEVRDLTQNETAYYGVSTSDNDDTIDVSTLTSRMIESGDVFQVTFSIPTNNYAIFLIPNTLAITSLEEQTFNQPSLGDFTRTDDVRTINTVLYDSYVIQNQSAVTGDLVLEVTIGTSP